MQSLERSSPLPARELDRFNVMNRARATPPDAFWRRKSSILFQSDFPLQTEKGGSGTIRKDGEDRFRGPVELGRQRPSAPERDADVGNEAVGIPDRESMIITENWQDGYRSAQSSYPL